MASEGRRVAFCFSGLTRLKRSTAESFVRVWAEPLEAAGFKVECHFYLWFVEGNERHVRLARGVADDYFGVDRVASFTCVPSEHARLLAELRGAIREEAVRVDADRVQVSNLVSMFEGIHRAFGQVKDADACAAVARCRLDVLYDDPVDAVAVVRDVVLRDGKVAVPFPVRPRTVRDIFALGSPTHMRAYCALHGARLAEVVNSRRVYKDTLHAEFVLRDHLAQRGVPTVCALRCQRFHMTKADVADVRHASASAS